MLGSPVDIAIAAVVVLIVFGPKKVPELGKALGQGLGNFKKALHEGTEEFKTAVNTDAEPHGETKPAVGVQNAPVAQVGATSPTPVAAAAAPKEEQAPQA